MTKFHRELEQFILLQYLSQLPIKE